MRPARRKSRWSTAPTREATAAPAACRLSKSHRHPRLSRRRKAGLFAVEASDLPLAFVQQHQRVLIIVGVARRTQHGEEAPLGGGGWLGFASHARRADIAEAQGFAVLPHRREPVVAAGVSVGAALGEAEDRAVGVGV